MAPHPTHPQHPYVLFHIDYGFIMGRDPKPMLQVPVFLSDTMISCFPRRKKEFWHLVERSFKCLRRHAEMFVALLRLLVTASPPMEVGLSEKVFEDQLRRRFLPGREDNEAWKTVEEEFRCVVDGMWNQTKERLIDAGHMMAQEGYLSSAAFSTVLSSTFDFVTNTVGTVGLAVGSTVTTTVGSVGSAVGSTVGSVGSAVLGHSDLGT